MIGKRDRAWEEAEHPADLRLVERAAGPGAAHRGIGFVAAARRVERQRHAQFAARSARRKGLEIGEGTRRIEAVDRDRLFGADAHLVGIGPVAIGHQEPRKPVEGRVLVLRQSPPFEHRIADGVGGARRRGRDRREPHLGAIPRHLIGRQFARGGDRWDKQRCGEREAGNWGQRKHAGHVSGKLLAGR